MGIESLTDTDPETLAKIDAWIREQHPKACEGLLKQLFPVEYQTATTATRMLAHCIDEHGSGLPELEAHEASSFTYHSHEAGLFDAIRRRSDRFLDAFLKEAPRLDQHKTGQRLALTILASLGDDHFRAAWNAFWPAKPPYARLAGATLRAAAWSEMHSAYASELLEKRLAEAFSVAPEDVVIAIMHAKTLEPRREHLIALLLSAQGLAAAKLLVREAHHDNPPTAIMDAVHLILREAPDDETAPIAVARALAIDPKPVIPKLVEWMNAEREHRHIDHRDLSWRLPKYANILLPAFAEDAIARQNAWQGLLAQMHHFRLEDNGAVAEWLEKNIDRDEATEYNAALLIEALSDMHEKGDPDLAKRLQVLAERLHKRRGTISVETLVRQHSLADPGLPDRDNLLAIALAKNVSDPPEVPAPEKLIQNIRALPHTYAALGGSVVEKEINASQLPVHYLLYQHDLEANEKELDDELKQGILAPDRHAFLSSRWAMIRARRQYWERLFRTVAEAGVKITPGYSRKLREIIHVWNEVRVLARLVAHFDVTLEPKGLPGMGSKEPEFLLHSEDGDIIFELATIGDKPSDLRTGVKRSAGGEAKRILNRKLKRQFGESKTGITLPVVIGIQMQWTHDLDFDLMNSLYGPLAFSFSKHKETGDIVREGSTRHVHQAFFAQDNVGCISAVAGIAPQDRDDGALLGQLFRPLREPDHPLPLPLWTRLRSALYGGRPPELLNEIRGVPGITEEEAVAFVDAGVDDGAFFAAERYDKPAGLNITDARWKELQAAAEHRQLLARTNALSDLKAAKGVDLSPLIREKIYIIKQLYEAPKPSDFPAKAWQAFIDEAEAYLGRPKEAPSALE